MLQIHICTLKLLYQLNSEYFDGKSHKDKPLNQMPALLKPCLGKYRFTKFRGKSFAPRPNQNKDVGQVLVLSCFATQIFNLFFLYMADSQSGFDQSQNTTKATHTHPFVSRLQTRVNKISIFSRSINEHTSGRQAPVTVWKNSSREQRQYNRYATGLCDTFIM